MLAGAKAVQTHHSGLPRFLSLVPLSAQITNEELEDELGSKEDRADSRLKEQDGTGNNEEAETGEPGSDGQRDGEDTQQQDQTVTKLQVSDNVQQYPHPQGVGDNYEAEFWPL